MKIIKINCLLFKFLGFLFFLSAIFVFFLSCSFAVDHSSQISRMEEVVFGKALLDLDLLDRVSKLEGGLFKKTFSQDTLEGRLKRLDYYLFQGKNFSVGEGYSQDVLKEAGGYENAETIEVTDREFLQILFEVINEERSFQGLLPLKIDAIANKVAEEHALELILKGHLSHFNLKNQGPDERYSLSGGTGALTEVIKGFQVTENNKEVILTPLLVKQLVQAILNNSDDVHIIKSSYVTHIGTGIAMTKNKKGFVSVIEFLIKQGEFEPLKPKIYLGEKLDISGKVSKPYKFKAISIAYFDNLGTESKIYKEPYFDNDSIKPYFPPQEYIAYGDTSKSNIAKFVKGLGFIGAIGAAPFTGGASAILAPVFLSSLQGGPPREIPLKGGVKAKKSGEFLGSIDLNYESRVGLYLINVLSEFPGANYPIVISRRTVRIIHAMNHVIGNNRTVDR